MNEALNFRPPLLQVGAVAAVDVAHGVPHQHRHVEHRRHAPQVRRLAAGTLAQQADHRLSGGQAARAQQHQHAVAGPLEHRHLAEAGVVVDTGVGARIAGQHQALEQAHAHAVGHAANRPRRSRPEALQRVGPEGAGQRHVAGIAPARDQHAADARRVVARVEGVPAVAQVGFEPAAKSIVPQGGGVP
jgi:hypothetical protein